MDNRREHPRFDVAVAVELSMAGDVIPCEGKNLSVGGVGVSVNRRMAEGAPTVVNLFLIEDGIEDATSPSLNLKATVMWTAETSPGRWEAGMRFQALSPQQQALIQKFLSRLG